MDYRNTIYCTTGFSPPQLVLSRNIRTRSNLINPKSDNNIELKKLQIKIKISHENQVKKLDCLNDVQI